MKRTAYFTAAASVALVGSTSARATLQEDTAAAAVAAPIAALVERALPANAPNGYTPQNIQCPPNVPSIRTASGLSQNETTWLQQRRPATLGPMTDLLNRMNITGFDATSYINSHSSNVSALPNIGIAVSGGGYRAMLNGAGVIEAFDNRTTNSTSAGQLGGLLQSATYLAGLSGGNWLVGSLFSNNFTSIDSIITQDTTSYSGYLWQLDQTIFQGPKNVHDVDYWAQLLSEVNGKKDAGWDITLTDYWGRSLSYQLVNATEGGPDYTFSSIAQQDWFTSGSTPMPFLVTDSRLQGQLIASTNSTIFTISPFEFGSEDPTLYAFAPLQYVGTQYSAGTPNTSTCVVGYDNVGYVMGTSSTLFNEALAQSNQSQATGFFDSKLQDVINALLGDFNKANDDIANWPNPFWNFNNGTNRNAQSPSLQLTDGGEDGQNIPLHPLIQPDRHVDVIFAVDSSADTNSTYPTSDDNAQNWPLAISLVATYERSLAPIANGTGFPPVPDVNTFVNLGLNNRPTFFGCNASNMTFETPIVVYLPMAPYVYDSNTSTFDLQYNDTQRNALVLNGYNLATQGNSSLDGMWPTCVGCAIINRSLNRTGTPMPDVCNQCFESYCWNGTRDSSTPSPYRPVIKLPNEAITFSAATPTGVASMSLVVGVALLTAFTLL